MALKKHGLGKGLDALIPVSLNDNTDSHVNKIDINLVKANSGQPRKYFDDEKISNLAQSIKEHGIIQPIVLKKKDKYYTIIAGERRWRAAKLLGMSEVPAIVMDLGNKEILEISLIENIQREDLNPIEEARAYKQLIEEFNCTHDVIGERLGKSRTAITNTMRLLNLDSRVQQYIIEGIISEGHGRTLLAISDNDIQYEFSQKIIDDSLSVRQTEMLIRMIDKKNVQEKKQEDFEDKYVKDIKNKLEIFFGTKVQFKTGSKNKGKIEIEYYSDEDLSRILELLNLDW